MPTTNQMMSRRQVVQGSEIIRYAAEIAPSGATMKTAGVLNARGRLGSRTRSTITPMDTITNASSVPIETRFPASRTVSSDATIATAIPVTIEVMYGVWNLGWTLLTNCGNRPSRAIEENTRDWPSNMTRITDDSQAMAPRLMS